MGSFYYLGLGILGCRLGVRSFAFRVWALGIGVSRVRSGYLCELL